MSTTSRDGALLALDSGTPEHQQAHHKYVETLRAHRNRDGGFWVAATDPLAADQALTGTVPQESVRTAVLLSDGASRLVDRFHLATWRQTLDLLDREGPEALISRVRAAEHSDPAGSRWPRGKTHDDATLVTLSLSRSPVPAAVRDRPPAQCPDGGRAADRRCVGAPHRSDHSRGR
ncbi:MULTISPECIES: hypothetical protein [Nonomuraea]|uniref:Uncharacterized protein n=1 Tax=Nonomuraea salmonea TaxID=46181 RepID=A0ABV5NXY5_9ACTN